MVSSSSHWSAATGPDAHRLSGGQRWATWGPRLAVAIKIHHNTDQHTRRCAVVEARINAAVEHPNIVRIHDIGEHDGQLFSVSELCEADLQSWCIRADWREILSRITEAGAGLSQLHSAGYVHGDIKPLNILIKNGVAKLADFGDAVRPGTSLCFGGTPGYIAPEVATGNRTVSGDVFALAVSAWVCSGRALRLRLDSEAGAAGEAGACVPRARGCPHAGEHLKRPHFSGDTLSSGHASWRRQTNSEL